MESQPEFDSGGGTIHVRKYVLLSLDSYQILTSPNTAPGMSDLGQIKTQILSQDNTAPTPTESDSAIAAKLNVASRLAPHQSTSNEQATEQEERSSIKVDDGKEQESSSSSSFYDGTVSILVESGMSGSKIERSKHIMKVLLAAEKTTLEEAFSTIADRRASELAQFLINIQQPTKKLTTDQITLVKKLGIGAHLVANTYAKRAASTDEVIGAAADASTEAPVPKFQRMAPIVASKIPVPKSKALVRNSPTSDQHLLAGTATPSSPLSSSQPVQHKQWLSLYKN